jgi:hypothetical protein
MQALWDATDLFERLRASGLTFAEAEEEVARTFGVSVRTLRQRRSDAGVSWRKIDDRTDLSWLPPKHTRAAPRSQLAANARKGGENFEIPNRKRGEAWC